MKVSTRSGQLAVALTMAASIVAQADVPQTDEEKLGYVIGMDIGGSLLQQEMPVDLDSLLDAIRATVEGGELALTPEEAQAFREAYIARRQAAAHAEQAQVAEVNRIEGEQFMAQNATAEGVMTTASGLQYKVVEQGTGAQPLATDTVTVHYRGTLLDGTEFDSSFSRNQPMTFQLNQVIAGWTEGLQLMPVGSKYEFYVGPDLGYGPGGGGPIPPNATLIFEVELLAIGPAE